MKKLILLLAVLFASVTGSFAWENGQSMSASGYGDMGEGRVEDNYMAVNINSYCDYLLLTGFISTTNSDAYLSVGAVGDNGLYYTYDTPPASGGQTFQYSVTGNLFWSTVSVYMEVFHGYAEVLLRWGTL